MTKKIIALALAAIMTGNINISAMSQADFVAQEVATFIDQSKEAGLTDEQMIEVLEKASPAAPTLTTKQRNALIITAAVLGVSAVTLYILHKKGMLPWSAKEEEKKDDKKKDADKDKNKEDKDKNADKNGVEEGDQADKAKEDDKEDEQVQDESEVNQEEVQNNNMGNDIHDVELNDHHDVEREEIREENVDPIIELPGERDEIVREIERIVDEVEHVNQHIDGGRIDHVEPIRHYVGDVVEPVDNRGDADVAPEQPAKPRRQRVLRIRQAPERVMPDRPGRGQGVDFFGFGRRNR